MILGARDASHACCEYGFTLDRTDDAFVPSHEAVRCRGQGKYFSANLGKQGEWSDGIRRYIDYVTRRDFERSANAPASNKAAADIKASKFRDPDGHLLELLELPPDSVWAGHGTGSKAAWPTAPWNRWLAGSPRSRGDDSSPS